MGQTTQVGSIVASVGGITRLQAGEQLAVIASDIGAGKDLTLIGKSVDLSAAQETSVQKEAQQASRAASRLASRSIRWPRSRAPSNKASRATSPPARWASS